MLLLLEKRKKEKKRWGEREKGRGRWFRLVAACHALATGRSCWPEWLLAGVVGAAGCFPHLDAPRENCWRKEVKIKIRGRRGEEKRGTIGKKGRREKEAASSFWLAGGRRRGAAREREKGGRTDGAREKDKGHCRKRGWGVATSGIRRKNWRGEWGCGG